MDHLHSLTASETTHIKADNTRVNQVDLIGQWIRELEGELAAGEDAVPVQPAGQRELGFSAGWGGHIFGRFLKMVSL